MYKDKILATWNTEGARARAFYLSYLWGGPLLKVLRVGLVFWYHVF